MCVSMSLPVATAIVGVAAILGGDSGNVAGIDLGATGEGEGRTGSGKRVRLSILVSALLS